MKIILVALSCFLFLLIFVSRPTIVSIIVNDKLYFYVDNYMLKKTLFLATVLGVFGTLTTTTDVRAGNEWNDSCRDAGYDDGQNGPFSQPTYDHCGDEAGGDDAYYRGFIEGCMDADNTRDVCEQATDAG